jgi:hypothetical protein
VLYALMDAVVDRYFPVIDALETELEKLEERMFAGGSVRANIEDMYQLKQKLMILKHAVGPLYEGVGKLCGGTGAASLQRLPGLLPGRLRPFVPHQSVGRCAARHGDHCAFGQPVAHHSARKRDHQAPRFLRRAGGRCPR